MKYAMIANDLVIGIVESETTPYWPPLDTGKQVYAKQCDQSVQIGDKVIDGEILGTKDWFSELKSTIKTEMLAGVVTWGSPPSVSSFTSGWTCVTQ